MQAMEQPAPLNYGRELNLVLDNPLSDSTHSRQAITRACTMCVKAKAKCMPHEDIEGVCQRCYRLKKSCIFQQRPVRKRTRTSKPTRVAQLEQKLDGLVTLLTSSQAPLQADAPGQVSAVRLPRSPASLDSNASTAGPSTATPTSIGVDGVTSTMQTTNGAILSNDPMHGATDRSLSVEPDEQEAENLLLEFKTNMADQFPFVVVSSESTSQSLQRERPLLWKAILVAASHHNSDRQLAIGSRLMEDLSTRMLLRNETSLDLLQALLIFVAWYHYHTAVNPQITNLLHLAQALTNSIGLNRTQTAYDRGKFFLDGHDRTRAGTLPIHGSSLSRSDGWRALAGCFYLTSIVSASCRPLDLQFNTVYILDCCEKLEEAGEYKSDALLVRLVRLQEIRYRMGRSFPYDDSIASRRPDAPVEMFVRAWQKELETFWASLPSDSQQHWLLLANYHIIEIALYEIDMGDCPMCLPRASIKFVNRTGKLEYTYANLLATRKVFDVYSSIPVTELSGICFALWAQFNHALLNAVKLLSSEADGWNLQHARNLLMIPDILHEQARAMEETISRRGLESQAAMDEKDVFTKFLGKVQQVLRWYESSRMSKMELQGPNDQPTESNGSIEETGAGESLPPFDDTFWQNLFDDNWMLVGDGLSI